MNGILIFLAIVVISSMIGAISRWLKNQQMEEQARLARQRAAQRDRARGDGQRGDGDTTVDTIDRYVAEIERLRQRKADAQRQRQERTPVARAAPPVVKPKRPAARPVTRREQPPIRIDSLPFAPTVAAAAPTPSPVVPVIVTPGQTLFPQATEAGESPITGPSANRPDGRSEVTRTRYTAVPPLLALLSTRQGLFTAVALAEILGEPRCKKRFQG